MTVVTNEIRTERLVLRQISPEDARVLAGRVRRPLPPAVEGYPLEGSVIAATADLGRYDAGVEIGPFGSYQVVRAEDGLVLGDIGFHGPPDARGRVTIGYGLAPEARGQGYATEALRALIDWGLARDDVSAVHADAHHENTASQRVMERAGMRLLEVGRDKRFYRLP